MLKHILDSPTFWTRVTCVSVLTFRLAICSQLRARPNGSHHSRCPTLSSRHTVCFSLQKQARSATLVHGATTRQVDRDSYRTIQTRTERTMEFSMKHVKFWMSILLVLAVLASNSTAAFAQTALPSGRDGLGSAAPAAPAQPPVQPARGVPVSGAEPAAPAYERISPGAAAQLAGQVPVRRWAALRGTQVPAANRAAAGALAGEEMVNVVVHSKSQHWRLRSMPAPRHGLPMPAQWRRLRRRPAPQSLRPAAL